VTKPNSLVERSRVEPVVLVQRSMDAEADGIQGYLRELSLTDLRHSLCRKRDAEQQDTDHKSSKHRSTFPDRCVQFSASSTAGDENSTSVTPPHRHDRLPARIALTAAEARFQIQYQVRRLKPQPLEQGAARYQYVMPAGGALHLNEVARPEILDACGVERDLAAGAVFSAARAIS
jgi:hypothetical protein